MPQNDAPSSSRRDFLKTSATAIAGAALATSFADVHAAGSDVIRVGLIGCGSKRGGRGRGAAEQCVNAGPNVKLVAMADVFQDHLQFTRDYLRRLGREKVEVSDDPCFVGFVAVEKGIHFKDFDLVILAS